MLDSFCFVLRWLTSTYSDHHHLAFEDTTVYKLRIYVSKPIATRKKKWYY
jgi:hypothetical protein